MTSTAVPTTTTTGSPHAESTIEASESRSRCPKSARPKVVAVVISAFLAVSAFVGIAATPAHALPIPGYTYARLSCRDVPSNGAAGAITLEASASVQRGWTNGQWIASRTIVSNDRGYYNVGPIYQRFVAFNNYEPTLIVFNSPFTPAMYEDANWSATVQIGWWNGTSYQWKNVSPFKYQYDINSYAGFCYT